MSRRCVLGLATAGIVAVFAVAGTAQAAAKECGLVGTWFGEAAPGMKWVGSFTPGTSATTGQLNLTWVTVDPTYGAQFPAHGLTGPQGVWQKVDQRTYKYTFFAYGTRPLATGYLPPYPGTIDVPVYALRTSGEATIIDCDQVTLTYKAEFMSPDLATTYAVFNGTGTENRMQLVTAP